MEIEGTAHADWIDLDAPLPLADGTRVRVTVLPAESAAQGSPDAVLRLVGTLTAEEADALLTVAQSLRSIDPATWP
ncbi:MAG: hypothetical protein CHACPFDD_03462 [Phycisphaerae bacterium]|nr:hypothetical protein [Phycisphaerae bacterium]